MSLRDLKHAWRAILRMPVLAAVVTVSLGLGIGVNATVFSWIQAMILRPIPGVRDASSFQLLETRNESGSNPGSSWLEFHDLSGRLSSFQELLAFRMVPLNIGESGRTERIIGELVSGNYFSALGLTPAAGRFLASDEVSRPGGDPVVVISHGFWRTRLASEGDAVGGTLRVNGHDLVIVGVAPPRFQGTVMGLDVDLWVPATLSPVLFDGSRELEDREWRGYSIMGRLAPGVSVDDARLQLDDVMRDLARDHPEANANIGADVVAFWRASRGPQRFLAGALAVLQGMMLVVLLAVCGNTANLMLARASTREREMGVRLALGASRVRVASLLLTEALVLGLIGAALGTAVAAWGSEALRAVPTIGAFPIRFQTGVDGLTIAFAALLGLGCGLVFGLAPALQLTRADPDMVLRAGSGSRPRSGLRDALVGTEVALAMMVLLAAALFSRNLTHTRDVDTGFRREGTLLAAYDLSGSATDAASSLDFAERLLARLRAVSGVEAAAIAQSVPLDIHGLPNRGFTLEGRARSDAGADVALSNVVTPDYFRVMGIPLRSGSDFADLADVTTDPQVIVNEEFVRRFVGTGAPIGRRLESGGRRYTIAGVVANSLYESFDESPAPIVYLSYRDRPAPRGEIHLRTRPGAEHAMAPEIERIVRELDPALSAYDVRTMAEHIEKNLFIRRIPARMFAVLGPLLLVLAAIGIYAVVSYSVSRRTLEIGVRLALGGTGGRVVGEIVLQSLRVIGFGAAAGWVVAFMFARRMMPDGVPLLPVLLAVPIVLMAVATFACWLPAWRAARADPVSALRSE